MVASRVVFPPRLLTASVCVCARTPLRVCGTRWGPTYCKSISFACRVLPGSSVLVSPRSRTTPHEPSTARCLKERTRRHSHSWPWTVMSTAKGPAPRKRRRPQRARGQGRRRRQGKLAFPAPAAGAQVARPEALHSESAESSASHKSAVGSEDQFARVGSPTPNSGSGSGDVKLEEALAEIMGLEGRGRGAVDDDVVALASDEPPLPPPAAEPPIAAGPSGDDGGRPGFFHEGSIPLWHGRVHEEGAWAVAGQRRMAKHLPIPPQERQDGRRQVCLHAIPFLQRWGLEAPICGRQRWHLAHSAHLGMLPHGAIAYVQASLTCHSPAWSRLRMSWT